MHYREYLPPGRAAPRAGRAAHGAARARAAGRRCCERERPQILHSYRDKANLWARLAARRAPVPIVLTAVRNRAISPLHLADRVVPVAAAAIACSRTPRACGASWSTGRGVAPEKIQILHNFIDLEKFHPPTRGAARRRRARIRAWRDDEVALLLPGRIEPAEAPAGPRARAARGWRGAGGLPPQGQACCSPGGSATTSTTPRCCRAVLALTGPRRRTSRSSGRCNGHGARSITRPTCW